MAPDAVGRSWIDAFNAHDVERLVALYADDCTHTSPKIRALHPETGGKLVGKPRCARGGPTPSSGFPAFGTSSFG
jgi:hypothetical protein